MKGVAPNCRKIHVDLPIELYERIRDKALEPPAISVAEWVRRVVAHHAEFDLPPARERKAKRIRLDGEAKQRTGPKPKYLLPDGSLDPNAVIPAGGGVE